LSSHSSDNPKVRKKTTKFWARSRGLTNPQTSRDDTLRFFQPFSFFSFSFFFLYWFAGYKKQRRSHAKMISSCQTRQVNSQFFSRVADNRHRLLLVFCFSKFVCVLPIPIFVLFFHYYFLI
jgi:hypothetical protein